MTASVIFTTGNGGAGGIRVISALAAAALCAACAMDAGNAALPPVAGIEVSLTPLDRFDGLDTPGMAPGSGYREPGYAAAVAATGGFVFVMDSSVPALLQLDPVRREFRLLRRFRDATTVGLDVTADLVIRVVDRFDHSVVELDETGWERRRFRDGRVIPVPVDVAVTDWGNTILIADQLSQRLATFDSLSNPTGVMTPTLSPVAVAASIRAIAATDRFVFVLDDAAREVTQLDLYGRPVASYGEDALLAPTALAVDACQRLFVADGHSDGLFVSSPDFQGTGARAALPPELAAAVTDLWIDENLLYVAAGSLGVSILAIDPPCLAP